MPTHECGLLKYKDSMKWSDEQTNRVGQLALVGKASKWVEYLTYFKLLWISSHFRRI